MNLTWSAATVLLILITPAFLLLAIFRVKFFPKIRTIGPKDSTLLLICCFISVILNFDLLAEFGSYVASNSLNYVELRTWERDTLISLFGSWKFAFKPVTWLFSSISSDSLKHNFILFLLDLHLRTLFLGWFFSLILVGIANFAEWREYLPYRPQETSDGCFGEIWLKLKDRVLDRLGGPRFTEDQSRYRSEIKRNKWLSRKLNEIRHAFYHPWSIITATNQKREILMVDVLTQEGSLYSGKLSTWVPDGEGISAISMEYALRYKEDKNPTQTDEKTGTPKSNRKKELVKNHGELVIPASQVITYHFWEIRRHFSCTIIVKKPADIEVVKWYVLLAFVHEGFIKKIRVQFGLEIEKVAALAGNLDDWMESNRIKLDEGILETQFSFEPDSGKSI